MQHPQRDAERNPDQETRDEILFQLHALHNRLSAKVSRGLRAILKRGLTALAPLARRA
jgi:hypothetical protein